MSRTLRKGVAAIAASACVAAAQAASPDARAIAAGCRACHQPAERTPPPLDGQAREELAAKLRAFRDGTRTGTVMPQLARGYSAAELEAAAAWFAAQPALR